ncbi:MULTISPECIES: transglycosylase domain-containing protein [unclassified Microbacterium]|uniref:transglycosylase domain-containing protein n=2 Tax=Microbacterium TaxID=33882 RepID=UPI00246847C3|nr:MULTISPECIES: transglycosylase domain-containing protein [unclassified Microbacterium]MDH5134603.1 transglycosylase domain-containing protein [Microbacterium sp. RD10]MDH5138157.1 transglycosylase domain-containing protein [Microbacterium sp. RD11]MDH5146123.1 transglycosylase domain-containing protein [Microbacterium sp. RD12]MDH5156172.1 transglycosylase domain-containing protein [Microbacterium sp. RD06]
MPQKNRTVKGVLGGLVGLVGLSAIAGLLVTASVTPVLAMTGVAGSTALTIFDELPEVLKVDTPMEQSTIYATNPEGKPVVLASFYEQNRVPVTYEQVAPVLYDAILSSEDKNFYTHGGVNLGATVKALVDNVRGTSSRGASTISQQFVKNVRIQQCEQNVNTASETYADELQQCWQDATNASGVDGIERKLQEMRYAIQIEKDYSKNDILLGYLNIANFGGTVYGIEAAARYYFSTSAAKLTVGQAATLAGIVQNPNTYRIDKPGGTYTTDDGVAHNSAEDGYKDAKDRRDYVLGRMLTDGKITQAQHDEAKAAAIEPAIKVPTQGCAAAGRNAYFCQYVKSIVENDEAFGADIQERRDLLRRGGLKIYTTLDFRVQDPAAEEMANVVPANFDNKYFGAAGVSIEVGTGRILSITQNTKFSETPTTDQQYSSLVFAGDQKYGKSGGFQVGSTYKLFTLIDWLEKGHSVRENLNGTVQTNLQIPVCGSPQSTDTAKIGNFGRSRGYPGTPMTFTAQSLNSGYFAMASKLDVCDINKVADKMGVTLASGEKVTEENVPYDVLGPKNISPIAMANAYATVASGGTYCTPRAIDKVIDPEGKERPLPKASCTEGVLSKEVAATAAYALQGVMAGGGTGARANPFDGTPLIGKTGTHDLWSTMMIESSTKVATAVWAGRSNGNHDNVFNVWTGSHLLNEVRYPLARAAQHAANQAYGGDRFPEPDGNLIRQIRVDVPDVVGQTVEEATANLERAGFQVSVGAPVDSEEATNIVVEQSPSGQAAAGATITISPSNGKGATVPDVTGQSPTEANAALVAAGFTTVEREGSCNAEGATVTATSPAANSAATKATPIRVSCK